VSVRHSLDVGERAERRAQRLIAARDRRRAMLPTARQLLRVAAWALALAAAGLSLGSSVLAPIALLVLAVLAAGLARAAGAVVPHRLTEHERAQLTVREVWRALRADGDVARPHARHAVWASETEDGAVQLWRLTRPAGDDYVITATLLRSLDPLDTAAAAEAMADERIAAERDERGERRVEARMLARALRA